MLSASPVVSAACSSSVATLKGAKGTWPEEGLTAEVGKEDARLSAFVLPLPLKAVMDIAPGGGSGGGLTPWRRTAGAGVTAPWDEKIGGRYRWVSYWWEYTDGCESEAEEGSGADEEADREKDGEAQLGGGTSVAS